VDRLLEDSEEGPFDWEENGDEDELEMEDDE
jgi:hypothetical protein